MTRTDEYLVEGKRIVVTGGAGFIGLHLSERLLDAGAAHVTVVDDFRCANREFVAPLLSQSAVEILELDLGHDDLGPLEPHLAHADALFHLAAEKHSASRDQPKRMLRANLEGTYALLELASRVGVGKAVFSSSLYAHGRRHLPPLHEDDRPCPTTLYGISKLAGEHLFAHFAEQRGLAHTALRLFFVFGTRQYPGAGYKSVISKNFERLIAGKPPIIRGDGQQSLDYVYVDDVVAALVSALRPAANGLTLHIGSGRGISIEELTRLMSSIAGRSELPLREDPDDTAGTHRVCAPGRAKECLGWTPRIPMEEGLRRVYAWMRSAAL